MMVSLYQSSADPLRDDTLRTWHAMLMRGRRDLRIGAYRTHAEPMQILSGRLDQPIVHFEAPPSARVPSEMRTFLEWFNRTGPTGREPLPALTRAGTAHLYFESIHPFEDGNGRIGRAIAEKALAQGMGGPALTALAATILRRRRAYSAMLEASSTHNDIDRWLAWFAGVALEAQARTRAQVEFVIDKSRLMDRVRRDLNARQEKVLLRVLAAGPNGFEGGLSASNYVSIAGTSAATARRDLVDLVDMGALIRTGERRYARYHLSIPLRPVAVVTIDEDGAVVVSDASESR